MKKLIRRILNHLTLFQRLLLSVLVPFLLACILFFVCTVQLFSTYNKELYRTTAQYLDVTAVSISSALNGISETARRMLIDETAQEHLSIMVDNPDEAAYANSYHELYEWFYSYMDSSKYIKAMTLMLDDGTAICMDRGYHSLTGFALDRINEKIKSASKLPAWYASDDPTGLILCGIEIRRTKYYRFDHLANLLITVDLGSLIRDTLDTYAETDSDSDYALTYGEDVLFSGFDPEEVDNLLTDFTGNYGTFQMNQGRYFVVTGTISSTGWRYYYRQNQAALFQSTRNATFNVICISLLTILISGFLIMLFLQRTLKNLTSLMVKINCFANGEPLPPEIAEKDYSQSRDEISKLHCHFDEMTTRVHILRDENYEKQLLLRDTNIKMLQEQINPHFLYNTLDTINWLAIRQQAPDIAKIARALGALFRAAIDNDADIIPLEEELEILEKYLLIQRIRFKNKLDFRLVLPESITGISVPKLSIQPLVENAVKYGVESNEDVCIITVSVSVSQNHCKIRVANSGSSFEEDILEKLDQKVILPQGSGIGITNINKRLKLLYGDNYGLHLYNKDGMAVVSMSVPYTNSNNPSDT